MSTDLLDELDAGHLRAAKRDATAAGGWRVDAEVKRGLLERFRDRRPAEFGLESAFQFVDRASLPPRRPPSGDIRIVPGGTTLRSGTYLGDGVVIMPPSYVNVGAWIGERTMIDSHVLVGSCAQVGARVHLSAGVILGGVLEPPGARPVIVEDDAFVGAGSTLLEGVVVQAGAVIAAAVTLTATTRLYDLANERVVTGTIDEPLVVPAGAVVIPGTRALEGSFAAAHGLAASIAIIAKWRSPSTDARTALEEALR